MTTIAYRDGVLAADTRVSTGGIMDCEIIKIARNSDGDLAGASGDAGFSAEFLRWFLGGEKQNTPVPKKENNPYEGLIFRSSGEINVFDEGGVCQVTAPYYASGSGVCIALGAMAYGADAEQAVRMAMKHDVSTGGEITVLRHGKT